MKIKGQRSNCSLIAVARKCEWRALNDGKVWAYAAAAGAAAGVAAGVVVGAAEAGVACTAKPSHQAS